MEGCLARVYRNSKPRYFLSYNLYDNSYYSTILTVGIVCRSLSKNLGFIRTDRFRKDASEDAPAAADNGRGVTVLLSS